MRPLRISARNFRTWRSLELELPAGVAAITGENGAGKSSILAALEQALFGGRGELARFLTRGGGEEQVEVACELEHRGSRYRIRRQAGSKPQLDFERLGLEPPESLSRESMAATQALIEETLGLSREAFRASALLMQGDGAAFTEAPPAKRKELLFEALGLQRYERLRELAFADRRAAQEASDSLGSKLAASEERLLARPALEEERLSAAEAEEARRAAAATAARSAGEAQSRLAERREQETARKAAAEGAEALRRSAEEAKEQAFQATLELSRRQAALADRPFLEALSARQGELEALAAAERSLSERQAELALLKQKAEESARQEQALTREADSAFERAAQAERALARAQEPSSGVCPMCERPLAGEGRKNVLARLRAALSDAEELHAALVGGAIEAAAARRELLALASEKEESRQARAAMLERRRQALVAAGASAASIAQAQARLELLAAGEAELPALQARLAELSARAQKLAEDHAALAGLPSEEEGPSLAVLEGLSRERADDLKDSEALLEAAVRRRAQVEERLAELGRIAAQAGAWAAEREQARAALNCAALLEEAFGRNGIPALILESRAIPQLEAEANRIIAELGRSLRFELRTQRELRGGGQAESLDIAVLTDSGEALYEDFSGGEQTRLNLALRISLARLLASSRAAEVGFLAIDEPSFLDEAGFARLASVLRGLEQEFPCILVVSHVPALRDAFSSTILVTGGADTGEPSHMEVQA